MQYQFFAQAKIIKVKGKKVIKGRMFNMWSNRELKDRERTKNN